MPWKWFVAEGWWGSLGLATVCRGTRSHAHTKRTLRDMPVGRGCWVRVGWSLGFSSDCWTQSHRLCQDRWQISCLEVTGDLMGFRFTAHLVSQSATCAATLVYTFTFKERHTSGSHSHLDGNKQFLTMRRKFRPRGPIPGGIDLWLTIFFWKILWLCL